MTLLKLHDQYPVPVSPCPHCGFRIDHSGWKDEGRMPEIGDLTLCARCARILRFGRRLVLTALSERDERFILANDPATRARVQQVRRQPFLSDIPTS